MKIGCLQGELFIPENRSLKEKRMLLRRLFDRLRNQFNVSVAEVDFQDYWQRAAIAIVCVNTTAAGAQRTLQQALNLIDQLAEAELINPTMDLI